MPIELIDTGDTGLKRYDFFKTYGFKALPTQALYINVLLIIINFRPHQ